ncbi:hypothetical protein LH61_04795 [Leuconostoc mesenteroides P45]|uniref:MMPL family transporter n=1 Tax=Leuconostoc mesenteroides TaxID=1245 RepID=UPI0005045230|nr:MMPL family transporter [Leuconostoc mesenteroides]KGB50817.1 hypothetical protein LH61_04795 [Leuconostoc mesenteroides P45]
MSNFFKWYTQKVLKFPKIILGLGVLVVISTAILGFGFGGALSSEGMTIGNTPAQKAADVVSKNFKNPNNVAQIQVVLRSKDSLKTNKNQKIISDLQHRLQTQKNVKAVMTPDQLGNYASSNKVAYLTVTYNNKAITETETSNLVKAVKDYRNSSFEIEFSGIVSNVEVSEAPEIVGISIAFVILVITFGSFLIAGLPIISAILGLLTGLSGIFVATRFTDVASYDLSLAAMVALAVGIDYALFIVARYRDEREKTDSNTAIYVALTKTGPSVIFAASTIIVALLGMSALGIGFLGVMGAVSALCVLLVVIVSFLIVPSILVLFPTLGIHHRIKFGKKIKPSRVFAKIINGHSKLVMLLSVIFLILVAIPASHIQLGLPNDGSKPVNTTERKAFDIKSDAYGAGNDAMLVTVVRNDGTAKVQSFENEVKSLDNIQSFSPAMPSANGKYIMYTMTPKTEANAHKTQVLVKKVRNLQKKINLPVYVTGKTAANIDISNKLMSALPKFLIIIVAFAFFLLMMAFRSILIPLVAVVGFVLSLLATLGVVVLTIQDGHLSNLLNLPGKSSVLNFLPVLVVGILFGLAMDYEVFLVSRIREEFLISGNNRISIEKGVHDTGSAIIAAALIMISVFASFVFTNEIIIQSMGLALASGVFFDAFIVRMLIVPAAINVFGKYNWYLPKWLDKVLPNLNIE